MLLISSSLCFISIISICSANYHGPFIMWGREDLKNVEISALQGLDDTTLQNIYTESSAIILFVRNSSMQLSEENFPSFKNLLNENKYYVYLTQHWLPSDPMDYNVNAEVINLVGPSSQQDVELVALYKDALENYGHGNVLGILASKSSDHEIRKRAAEDESTTITSADSTTPSPTTTTSTMIPELGESRTSIFYAEIPEFSILMYSSLSPILKTKDKKPIILNAKRLDTVSKSAQTYMLKTRYHGLKLSIQYSFTIVPSGYWTLTAAEVTFDGSRTINLALIGENPSAPRSFSYKCAQELIFRNGSTELKLIDIQVQPNVRNGSFGSAYDCIGFTSAPIWAGIFVSLLICLVGAIGINSILEIKTPNRFENSRGKQLTFTIQE